MKSILILAVLGFALTACSTGSKSRRPSSYSEAKKICKKEKHSRESVSDCVRRVTGQ